jgi:hypothetical protein
MKKMDFAERVEHCQFLGREFLLFLWWKSELTGGTFELEGFGELSLTLESHIVLERKVDVLEQTRMKGPDPSSTKVAKEALRYGKMPTRGALRIIHEEREYAFVIVADEFTLRQVKLPVLLTEDTDEQFTERMTLLATLESMLDALYLELLSLRLSPAFRDEVLPAMRAFAQEQEAISASRLTTLLGKHGMKAKKKAS